MLQNFPEEESRVVSEISSPLAPLAELPIHPALPRDRFAAFFLDTVILVYMNFALYALLKNNFLLKQNSGEILWQFVFYISGFFIFSFFYYLLFESIGGATPGKLLCRLRVVDMEGDKPPLANIFLRNLCRIFDYPFFFLIAVLSMESSPSYQRLGDRAARTLVIKKTRQRLTPIDLRSAVLASTLVRALTFFLDLLLYGIFLGLYLSALNPDHKILFQVLLGLFPFLSLCYFMIFEFASSTTPGKFILKRQGVLENGEPLDASAAIIRNLFLPLDMILGYPLLILSRRKQRLGDLVAETLVIKKKLNRNGVISLSCLLIVLSTLGYLSFKNPHRGEWMGFVKEYFLRNGMPLIKPTAF